jgi:hypothetical protein
MRRAAFRVALAATFIAVAAPVYANWTASGQILYQHREWDQTGFTGAIVNLPVRYADVEVIDPNKNGANRHLAWGKTDANGNFSILVTDSSTRAAVRASILTQTTQTSDLFVKVTTPRRIGVLRDGPDALNHGPNTNVNWGTLTAQAFGGAEAFNILDRGVYGADFIKVLTGSRPNSSKLVTFKWSSTAGNGNSFTSGNTVNLRDTAGYDDTVISARVVALRHDQLLEGDEPPEARTSSPNVTKTAPGVRRSTRFRFFGCSVRRYFGWTAANVYLKTDGGSGPGHVVNWYNLEDPEQYACQGDTSEVANSRTMWDIGDGASTTDTTPGVEDTPLTR